MRNIFIFLFITFITSSATAADLVNFDSKEGVNRLEHSTAKVDFFPLANHFESQENKMFCGLASSAIVLNSLRLDDATITKPEDNSVLSTEDQKYLPKGFNPFFQRYTQHNLLSDKTKSKSEVLGKPVIINGKQVSDYGLQLRQLANLLTTHGLDVTVRVVDESLKNETISTELISNLQTAEDYILVNYSRDILGQGKAGHISPLGAYDKGSDSFLIMDVNPNAARWVWVKTSDLIAAMRTLDVVENRGYVLIKK